LLLVLLLLLLPLLLLQAPRGRERLFVWFGLPPRLLTEQQMRGGGGGDMGVLCAVGGWEVATGISADDGEESSFLF